MAADAPVFRCGRCSDPGVPASTTTCRFARQEPSFSSMKEKPFESRRVRTQPLTLRFSFSSVEAKTCLIKVRIVHFIRVPIRGIYSSYKEHGNAEFENRLADCKKAEMLKPF